MSTIFNPTSTYSTTPTTTKNWWDTPTSSQLGSKTVAGYELPDYTSFFNTQKQNTGNLLSGQDIQTGNWLSNYSNALQHQETLPAMYTRIGEELNIPGLQRQSQDLTANLNAIPETYGNATRGFDVNANQLSRIVGTKQAALAPLQQQAVSQLQTAEQQRQAQAAAYVAQQEKEMQPYMYEREFLTDRIARETSMFTQEAQNELAALNAKTSAGVQLSEGEANRKNELEKLAKQFEYNKALAQQQIDYSEKVRQNPTQNERIAGLANLWKIAQG